MTDRIFGILTFFLFTMSYTNAQNINIPDPVFKDFLTQELCIDKNGDGRMDDDADTNDDGQIDVALYRNRIRQHLLNKFNQIK